MTVIDTDETTVSLQSRVTPAVHGVRVNEGRSTYEIVFTGDGRVTTTWRAIDGTWGQAVSVVEPERFGPVPGWRPNRKNVRAGMEWARRFAHHECNRSICRAH